MEWLTDLQPKQLNYSDITPRIAVGGAFRKRQIKRLKHRGVTAVVDCRLEARDDPQALRDNGIEFLHVPTLDRHGFTFDQMAQGVEWVLDHTSRGGRAFLHCEHGVGRGPLLACCVLVAQGYSAPEALGIVRSARWQALPNDRQLTALLAFEQRWRERRSEKPLHPERSPLHPERSELHPERSELHPERSELHPERSELHPERSELHPERSELHPERSQLHPEPSQLHPERSQLHPERSQLHPERSEGSTNATVDPSARKLASG